MVVYEYCSKSGARLRGKLKEFIVPTEMSPRKKGAVARALQLPKSAEDSGCYNVGGSREHLRTL
jgi:hypothetical protein